jgi:hypothetical protein
MMANAEKPLKPVYLSKLTENQNTMYYRKLAKLKGIEISQVKKDEPECPRETWLAQLKEMLDDRK